MFSNISTTPPPHSTTSLPQPATGVPESCLPLVNNEYRQVYSCNISHDAALLGLVSLFLTMLNITCIFVMGIIVLKVRKNLFSHYILKYLDNTLYFKSINDTGFKRLCFLQSDPKCRINSVSQFFSNPYLTSQMRLVYTNIMKYNNICVKLLYVNLLGCLQVLYYI